MGEPWLGPGEQNLWQRNLWQSRPGSVVGGPCAGQPSRSPRGSIRQSSPSRRIASAAPRGTSNRRPTPRPQLLTAAPGSLEPSSSDQGGIGWLKTEALAAHLFLLRKSYSTKARPWMQSGQNDMCGFLGK